MFVSTLKTWSEVRALAGEWNELLRASSADTLFLTWEWLSSWIDLAAMRVEPFFVTVRDDGGRLLGAAPFYRSGLQLLRSVRFETLRIASDHATGFEYADWPLRTGCETEAAGAIVAELARRRREWDLIWMPLARGWTGAHQHIVAASRAAGFLVQRRSKPFGAFPLPTSLEQWELTFSGKRRQQLRRHRRRLLGTEGVAVARCEQERDLPLYLEALYDLHGRRRMLENDPGTFVRKPLQVRFYDTFTRKALASGWLRLYALFHDDRIHAIQLGYVYNNVFHQIQEGFNPEYVDGAGNVLRHVVIEECIKEGVAEYDFLGGYTEHKRRWGAVERIGYDVLIGRPTLRGRLLFAGEVWPSGRYMRALGLVDGSS